MNKKQTIFYTLNKKQEIVDAEVVHPKAAKQKIGIFKSLKKMLGFPAYPYEMTEINSN